MTCLQDVISTNNFWQVLHQASDSACRLNQDGESDTNPKRQRQCKDTERDKMVRPYGLGPELQHVTRMFHMRGITLLRVSWYQCHFRCPSWIHLAVSLDSFHFGCLGFAWIIFSYLPALLWSDWSARTGSTHTLRALVRYRWGRP